jgi:hypothetical protein
MLPASRAVSGEEHGNQLRNERQGHFVDLGGRLKHRYQQTDGKRREQHRRRYEQHHFQSLLADGKDRLGGHAAKL